MRGNQNQISFQLRRVQRKPRAGFVLLEGIKEPVPSAYVAKLRRPSKRKRGAPVLFIDDRSVAVRYGRVLETAGEQVRILTEFASTPEQVTVPAERVSRLDGKKKMGQPVAFRSSDLLGPCWKFAQLVCWDPSTCWLANPTGGVKAVAARDVLVIRGRDYKPGQKAWAPFVDTYKPVTIVEANPRRVLNLVAYPKKNNLSNALIPFAKIVPELP